MFSVHASSGAGAGPSGLSERVTASAPPVPATALAPSAFGREAKHVASGQDAGGPPPSWHATSASHTSPASSAGEQAQPPRPAATAAKFEEILHSKQSPFGLLQAVQVHTKLTGPLTTSQIVRLMNTLQVRLTRRVEEASPLITAQFKFLADWVREAQGPFDGDAFLAALSLLEHIPDDEASRPLWQAIAARIAESRSDDTGREIGDYCFSLSGLKSAEARDDLALALAQRINRSNALRFKDWVAPLFACYGLAGEGPGVGVNALAGALARVIDTSGLPPLDTPSCERTLRLIEALDSPGAQALRSVLAKRARPDAGELEASHGQEQPSGTGEIQGPGDHIPSTQKKWVA